MLSTSLRPSASLRLCVKGQPIPDNFLQPVCPLRLLGDDLDAGVHRLGGGGRVARLLDAIDRIEPAELTERIEPTDAIESIEPTDHRDRNE